MLPMNVREELPYRETFFTATTRRRTGEEDMRLAIANSCNTYFVNLMQQVDPSLFLGMAERFGFGSAHSLLQVIFQARERFHGKLAAHPESAG